MRRQLLVIPAIFLVTGSAWAQNPPASDQTEQMRALLERIERLERRVAELESKQSASPTTVLTAVERTPVRRTEPQEAAATPGPTHDHAAQEQAAAQQAETHYPDLHI